jgi:hypothetical protein
MDRLVSQVLLLCRLDAAGVDILFSSRRGGWLAFNRDYGLIAGPCRSAVEAGRAGLAALDREKAAA